MIIVGIDPGDPCGIARYGTVSRKWTLTTGAFDIRSLPPIPRVVPIAIVEDFTPKPYRGTITAAACKTGERVREIVNALSAAGIRVVLVPAENLKGLSDRDLCLWFQNDRICTGRRPNGRGRCRGGPADCTPHSRAAARHVHVWLSNERRRGGAEHANT